MINSEPLIYTTKGNMPVSELDYSTSWGENGEEIAFAEEYRHQGEIVRRSVHIMKKRGAEMGAEQARVG